MTQKSSLPAGPRDCDDKLIQRVVGTAITVHRELGPGLLESVYERALMLEFVLQGIPARAQVPISVSYRGRDPGLGFRADLVVDDALLLELKCVDKLRDIHLAQVITYLKLLYLRRGLILNFNHPLLKQGIRRVSI